jgi:hypothetical protein
VRPAIDITTASTLPNVVEHWSLTTLREKPVLTPSGRAILAA